jgi:GTPase SAR1 family protein
VSDEADVIFKVLLLGNQHTKDPPIQVGSDTKIGTNIAVTNFTFSPLKVKLIFWRFTAVPGVPDMWEELSRGANGVFYVFNVRDQSSFDSITKWMHAVQKEQGPLPAVLIGTHADPSQDRVISFFQAASFAKTRGMTYFDTSIHGGPSLTNPIRNLTFEMVKQVIK